MSVRSLFESGGGQSSVIRWASLAVILGLGLFVLGVVMSGGDSPMGSAGISSSGVRGSCHAQSSTYKRVHTDTGIELFALREDTHYAKYNLGAQLPKFYSGMLCQNDSGSPAGGNSSNVTSCQGVVLDVGAYLGTHALYLASLGYEVHAFEIQDTAAELLRCAASAAKLDNVMVTQEGISDENGYECMLATWGGPAETQLVPKVLSENVTATVDCPYPEWTKVPVVTLDHYWQAVLLKRPIHFMKIDVEGHEDLVLKGANEMMQTAPPAYILIEYNHNVLVQKQVDVAKFMQRIYDLGYHVYDCQMQEMLTPGFGTSVLESTYANKYVITDLLLIHKDTFTKAALKDKGTFVKIPCGHDEDSYKKPTILGV